MRKYLEDEMLADSLRSRVRYNCTEYVGMDGCRVFELFIDGKCVKRFSHETLNSYFINHGMKENNEPRGRAEYWDGYWQIYKNTPMHQREEYTDEEFCEALKIYRESDIGDSIRSSDPIVRMFAVLDRRVGKRRLERLKATVSCQPSWLRIIYELRFEAEKSHVCHS